MTYATTARKFRTMTMSDARDVLASYGDPAAVLDEAALKLPGRATLRFSESVELLKDLPPRGMVLFLTGSRERGLADEVAQWMDDLPGWAMLAPATHALKDRPRYISPADKETYRSVHRLRIAEIDFCLAGLRHTVDIETLPLALIGLSEGAVASLAWSPRRSAPRVCLAWSCEETYFSVLPTLPEDVTTPVLNVIGGTDPYFSAQNSIAAGFGLRDGHGARTLLSYRNSKVIIYPSAGHDIIRVQSLRSDVTGFLQEHLFNTDKLTEDLT